MYFTDNKKYLFAKLFLYNSLISQEKRFNFVIYNRGNRGNRVNGGNRGVRQGGKLLYNAHFIV